MSEPAAPTPGRSWRGVVVLVLGAVAIAHSVVVGLWLAPSGPVRDEVGSNGLTSYVDPYFRQSWTSLQPSAQQVDEALLVRARIASAEGRPVSTGWVDVTAEHSHQRRHDLTPSRATLSARRLATNLNAAMLRLGEEGQKLVREDYASRSLAELRAALTKAKVDERDIDVYLVVDQMATRFASLYAQAHWKGDIVEVKVQSGHRRVPARGGERRIGDVDFTWFTHGWRKAYRGPVGARLSFRDWVRS